MIAVAAWQHIALGFLVLIMAPLLPRQWIRRYGRGLTVLVLCVAWGQVFIGVSKLGRDGIRLSTGQGTSILGVAAALCVLATWWILRKSRRNI